MFPLVACVAPALQERATDNGSVTVERLFTHEGCTMYRFKDAQYHYYVRCAAEPPATISTVSCGKNCTREETISTERAPPVSP